MAKIINKNQYRKIYPIIIKRPVYASLGSGDCSVETAILTFSGDSEVSYTFSGVYNEGYPVVTVVAAGTDNNVNLFISSISKTSVTISSSAAFTGTAHLVAVKRST